MRTLILLISCFSFPVNAQDAAVDELVKANSFQIVMQADGNLSGNGIVKLLGEAAKAQFVLLGENHNTKEIPQFTSSLFALLNKSYGFSHLALEQDPPMMRMVSALKSEPQKVFPLARKYPYGFTFVSDQELEMISEVIAFPVKGNAVWGCDQSFGASHVLDEIKPSNADDSQFVDNLKIRVSEKERRRDLAKQHFMSDLSNQSNLQKLKSIADEQKSKSVNFGVNSLLESDTIYSTIQQKSYYESRSRREDYMKSRFMEEYRLSQKGEELPKVVLKFGNEHLQYGFNSGGFLSLGSFVKSFALANGKDAISINALIFRQDGSDWDFKKYPDAGGLRVFTRNTSVNKWTLFDLRPIRAAYYNRKLPNIITAEEKDYFESLVNGFDFLLLIGNGGDGTFETCQCDG